MHEVAQSQLTYRARQDGNVHVQPPPTPMAPTPTPAQLPVAEVTFTTPTIQNPAPPASASSNGGVSDLLAFLNATSTQVSQLQASNSGEWALIVLGRSGKLETRIVDGNMERLDGLYSPRSPRRGLFFTLGTVFGFLLSICLLCVLVMCSGR
jgi:hypothetical protein